MKLTRTCFPGGTSTVWTTVFDDVITFPATVSASTPAPPSLPMISLVIANLNPRDLMQLARLGIEVVIPSDSVRYIHWFAYA